MNPSNLPPGVLPQDIDGPPMPRCKRCSEEVNDVNDIGLCQDCDEDEADDLALRLKGEIGRLNYEIAQLRDERRRLTDYVRHAAWCPMPYKMCSCGLNTLLNSLKKPSH